ncbi:MAG: LLM class flavin-dependent oxidoreductase, partial [Actinomycetota bacterium]
WYGQPYPKPLARTREYIEIIRRIIAREEPVAFEGEHYQLPHPGGLELGKPLKSTVHPLRTDLPIYLAAEGPKNVALSAEISDGWLPLFFSPNDDDMYRAQLTEGFSREGARRSFDDFEVIVPVSVIPGDDVDGCADLVRPMLALYMGGMGARGANFHFDVFVRMGYEDVAVKVQDLYLDGRKDEAAQAIPLELVESVALVGPPDKIKEELEVWERTVVTTLLVSGPPQALKLIADVVNG